eukprot:TRINITY_DN11474_c0_g1_i1.p1 TRINITY_DN11474_c0_g1~~TRINITY_DN11474_c0_g1_i1.p1  ORF type:complete len:302 (+),score=43.53 TRINITY_DN11474_c0_g1_i1:97-1002(+)
MKKSSKKRRARSRTGPPLGVRRDPVAEKPPHIANWRYEYPNKHPDEEPEQCPSFNPKTQHCPRGSKCPLVHQADLLGDNRSFYAPRRSLIQTDDGNFHRADSGVKTWKAYITYAGWKVPPQWAAQSTHKEAPSGDERGDSSRQSPPARADPVTTENPQEVPAPRPRQECAAAHPTRGYKVSRQWSCKLCSSTNDVILESCDNCGRARPRPAGCSPRRESTGGTACSLCSFRSRDPLATTCSMCGEALRREQPGEGKELRMDPTTRTALDREGFFAAYGSYDTWDQAKPVFSKRDGTAIGLA